MSNNGFDYRKAIQAVNFIARKYPENRVNKMKALKLLWVADRFHLRRYGRPLSGDTYVAMKYGMVASVTRDILENNSYLQEEIDYAKDYIHEEGYDVKSVDNVDEDIFSQSDIEALNFAFAKFGDLNQWELANITHKYPEWNKFEEKLRSGIKVQVTDYIDFFNNPTKEDDFEVDNDTLESSKEIFEESEEARQAWM